MLQYWLYYDRYVQEGDLRRMMVLTSNELSLEENLRGPFTKKEDAFKVAESLIQNIAEKTLERLRTEKPRNYATFPTGSQTMEK
jgi:hypothetical protein